MFDWFKQYESLDEIDEDKRGAFVERDGKFVLDRPLDPSGLKSTVDKQKKEIAGLRAFQKRFQGYTDEQLETLADDLDELESLRAEKEAGAIGGDDAKLSDLVEKRVAAERKKLERETDRLKKQLEEATEGLNGARGKVRELTLGDRARAAAAKAGVKEHSLKYALYEAGQRFDVNEDGEIVDKNDEGLSLEDFFLDVVPQNPGWTFDPKASGTGQSGGVGANGRVRVTREQIDKMDPKAAAATMAKVRAGELEFETKD